MREIWLAVAGACVVIAGTLLATLGRATTGWSFFGAGLFGGTLCVIAAVRDWRFLFARRSEATTATDDVSAKRAELSALIQQGVALKSGMSTSLRVDEDRLAESIRLMFEVEQPLAGWLDASWGWVTREAPGWLGLVHPVDEWPERVAAVDSYPKLVEQRVAELRDVLKRL